MTMPNRDPNDNSRNALWTSEYIENAGPFLDRRPASDAMLARWKGVLPDIAIDFWKQYGMVQTHGGLIQWCDPDEMSRIIRLVFGNDPDFDPDQIHVYAYSAFGSLYAWNKDFNKIEIDLTDGWVWCTKYFAPNKQSNVNLKFISALEKVTPSHHDLFDEDRVLLFDRTVAKLGRLDFGECYGFFPALSLGGATRLENLKRVKALEHFVFLAQAVDFKLTGVDVMPDQMRLIGG